MKLIKIITILLSFLTFSYASNKSNTEQIGDLFLVIIPASAYTITFLNNDEEGRNQFYKSFGTNVGATYFLKYSIDETRPDNSDNHSFPSGHSSITFQSAAFMHKRYGLNQAIPAYLAATFTGWSRIDSDKHYTHDVLTGAALGIMSSFYFTTSYNNISITPLIEDGKYTLQLSYVW